MFVWEFKRDVFIPVEFSHCQKTSCTERLCVNLRWVYRKQQVVGRKFFVVSTALNVCPDSITMFPLARQQSSKHGKRAASATQERRSNREILASHAGQPVPRLERPIKRSLSPTRDERSLDWSIQEVTVVPDWDGRPLDWLMFPM